MQSIAITQSAFGVANYGSGKADILSDSLLQALCILERALSFDSSAILLNDTMDDPITTNIPSSWNSFICKPETV